MARRTFTKRFEITVPARSPIGPSPSREETFDFILDDSFRVVREGATFGARVSHANFGGLTERRREFSARNNGVRLVWKLSNGEVFPVTGRKAVMDVELDCEQVQRISLSAKYLALRQRFFEQFFFEGLVAEWVDTSIRGGKVKFADQTLYQGQALLVLATELAILRASGQAATDARTRISEILNTVERLDRVAGARFGGRPDLDGFFVRDDAEGPSDPRLANRFAECDSDWQNPERENASPSGDQIFGLMYGLSAVVHFSGDVGLAGRAKQISSRLYDYARRCQFHLRLPNGNATRRGSEMQWLASLLHGLNLDITGQNLFNESRVEIPGAALPLTGVASFWDDPVTARQVADLAGREFSIPGINQTASLNSFALHIILMAIAHGDVWSQAEVERVATKVHHHASVLLYCLRHPGRLPVEFNPLEVQGILDACPDEGPRASLDPATGWNKDNRWVRSAKIGEPSSGGTQEYNGVDWLLLHNLSQLVLF